jgi:UPF0716 protein FxsA
VVLFAILVFVVAEIVAFVAVADHIGILLALLLLLGVSAAGPLLVRRAGRGVVEHARQRILRGETPDREVLDGVVLLLGGVLVCVPGFIGDFLGLLLLIGPVRHAAIRLAGRQLGRRVASASMWSVGSSPFGRRGSAPDVIDATTHEPGAHKGPPPASGPAGEVPPAP